MASVTRIGRSKRPPRAVQFVAPDGVRKTIRVGPVGYETALDFKRKVEKLLAWSITNEAPDAQTATWLAGLPARIHARLARVGLVEPRTPEPAAPGLGNWLGKHLKQRPDLKPSSRQKLERTGYFLRRFYDTDLPIDGITADSAADWRVWLGGQGLAEATVRLHCRNAKCMFNEACERELIKANPFRKLTSAAVAASRERYVTPGDTAAVLNACPSVQWRALVGLARLAGLRVPSETHRLTWADLDWSRGRLSVHSPKTERYSGHESRIVPIVPALMTILQNTFDAATEGQEQIIALSRNNLHRTLEAIVKRAGMAPWPRPFQTLRQSCDSEWKLTFPAHAVDQWLGHSAEVSRKHYLMVPDHVYDLAAGLTSSAESAAESAAAGPRTELNGDEHALKPGERKRPQNAVCAGSGAKNEDGPGGIRTPDQAIMSRLL